MQPIFYSNNSAFQRPTISEPSNSSWNFNDQESMLFHYSSWEFGISQKLLANQQFLQRILQTKHYESQNSSNAKLSNQNQGQIALDQEKFPKKLSDNDLEDFGDLDPAPIQDFQNEGDIGARLRKKKKIRYHLEDSFSAQERSSNKSSQTKNVIKNFMNCIFNFVIKEIEYHRPLLEKLNICEKELLCYIEKNSGKICSIQDLRCLWCSGKFSNFFRTVCESYFRKRYYGHIFNSRVLNHKNHLKYRRKILQSMRKPEHFHNLKDF